MISRWMSSSDTDVASSAVLFGEEACERRSVHVLLSPTRTAVDLVYPIGEEIENQKVYLEQRHYGLAGQHALLVAVVPLAHRREQRSPRLHDAALVRRRRSGDLVEEVEEARRRGDGRVNGDSGPCEFTREPTVSFVLMTG